MATKKKPIIVQSTIADALSSAFGEFESLGEEMRSWADSIEEKLSHTEKYSRVSECADSLEQFSEPTYDDSLGSVKVEYPQYEGKSARKGLSRADRCSNACLALDACISVLDELIENDPQLKDSAENLRSDIDDIKGDAEGLEFPGMYG